VRNKTFCRHIFSLRVAFDDGNDYVLLLLRFHSENLWGAIALSKSVGREWERRGRVSLCIPFRPDRAASATEALTVSMTFSLFT
jgi:hypothetical protein